MYYISNNYIHFSSLFQNSEYAASILNIHWQSKNTFYISYVVTYQFCVFLHLQYIS